MDSNPLAGCSITAIDFIAVLKQLPAATDIAKRDVLAVDTQMSRRAESASNSHKGADEISRSDSTPSTLTDNALASGRTGESTAQRSRKADKLKEKELRAKAAERQGALW